MIGLCSMVNTKQNNEFKKSLNTKSPSQMNQFSRFQDCVDDLLENVDSSLDIIKGKSQQENNSILVQKGSQQIGISNQDVLTKNDDSLKPQLYFHEKVDNYAEIFIPKLNYKPNCIAQIDSDIV